MSLPAPLPSTPIGKLAVPRLGRVFDRTRLFGLLDGLAHSPAIWIAAPPGAGKTTLAVTWLEHSGQPTRWLQVDRSDADPATFIQSFDALLREAIGQPVDGSAVRADELADLSGCLRRRVRLLAGHTTTPWNLVFDNHQELPADSPLHPALALALAELPPGVRWIFLSREPPPAAYTRALALQQLAVVDAEPLRFDEVETQALVSLHGRLPTATAIASLGAASGWAAGMILMLLGSAPEEALLSLNARQRVFDYFASEVLDRMPPEEQRALGAIAYLPRASAVAAAAVSGHPAAGDLLERLSAQSLFTDRRAGPPTIYVFHALFSEFLRKRHERTASAAQIRTVRRHAGHLLAAAGDVDAGLDRLIEAGDWSEAESLILKFAPRYVAEGRTRALRQQVDALPAEGRSRLTYWRGFCAIDSDPAAALVDLADAFERSAATGDVEGQLFAAAAAATALVSTGQVSRLDRWIAVLEQHAARAALVGDEDCEMRLVPGLFAALVYRRPWHVLAEPLAARAERLLHLESAPGQRLLLGSLALHLLWRGHLDRLETIVLRVDQLCAQGRAAPATMVRWWGVGILVKTLLGRIDSARSDAAAALSLVQTEASVAPTRVAMELMAMFVAQGAADADAARLHMHNAARDLHPDNHFDRATYEHQRGLLALQEGDCASSLRLTRAAAASAAHSGFPMREHISLIANALAAAMSDEHDEARRVLQAVFAHPFYDFCRWHHWVAGSVAAYAALRRGDQDQALEYLRHAFGVARACGYRHGPMLVACGDMMPRLAALALRHGVEPAIARDLVNLNQLKAPPQADACWPWAVRLFALGPLVVERADGPLPVSRKSSRKLLDLLGLLAAEGARPIAQDRVADALWPDADGDAARNALDNALHRLRKLLGGDDRILLRNGALLLNPARCWSDVGALELTLEQLPQAPAADTPALMQEVVRLYRSPLLAGDESVAIGRRRAALHQRVVRAMQAAGERVRAAGLAQPGWDALESLPDL